MLLPNDLHDAIAQIHAAPQRLVFEFAGAGSLALWWLHSVAGSSGTILEATDRYASASLADLLGGQPNRAVAPDTARTMARRAYARAAALSDAAQTGVGAGAWPLLGVACTAAIATSQPRRGDHHCIVAIQRAQDQTIYMLRLTKGLRDRTGEEVLVSQLILWAIGRACGLEVTGPLDLAPGERVVEEYEPASDPLARLLAGAVRSVTVAPDGSQTPDQPFQGALVSGAFNPLHAGHLGLAAAAAAQFAQPVAFELPVINADKGTLIAEEVRRRLRQFAGAHTVLLTRAALFVEKAALFPGCSFVIGYDTAVRLVNPRYYGGEAGLAAAFERLQAAGCRFLVGGRLNAGAFRTLAQMEMDLPPAFRPLFVELPETAFRVDISSTELRRQAHDTPPDP